MNSEHIENGTEAVQESTKVLPLDGGRHCPPFKARLFDLADHFLSGESLDEAQEQLMNHVEACRACRSIYNSAIYFANVPLPDPAQNAFAELERTRDEGTLRKLQTGRKRIAVRPVSFTAYLTDVIHAAGISESDALRELGVPRGTSIQVLDEDPRLAVNAALAIGIEREQVRGWLCLSKWNSQSRTAGQAIAPRLDNPDVDSTENVAKVFRDAVSATRSEFPEFVDRIDALLGENQAL